MMHESNEINCFSWITNLISKQTSAKTTPHAIHTRQNQGEKRGNDERESRERERGERREEREATRVFAKQR